MENFFIFISKEWILVSVLVVLIGGYFFYSNLLKAKLISLQAFVFDMNNNKDLFILDIRDVKDYKHGHIKNAVNYPAKTYDDIEDKMGHYKEHKIVVVCNQGVKAQDVANELLNNDFNAYVLEGGMVSWINAGFPVEK